MKGLPNLVRLSVWLKDPLHQQNNRGWLTVIDIIPLYDAVVFHSIKHNKVIGNLHTPEHGKWASALNSLALLTS
jgi:hypothetical protein